MISLQSATAQPYTAEAQESPKDRLRTMSDSKDEPARAPRRSHDWEEIEAQYRAGVLSSVQIATAHGITEGAIRKRAKAESWVRDLSAKIRVRTEAALVRAEVRGKGLDEKGTIKQAVITRVEIGERQRARIHKLTVLADKIITRLEDLTTDDIQDFAGARVAMDVTERATRAVGQLVALERQAWAMDAPDAQTQTTANACDELVRRLSAMAEREQ
jgi:hypothetical protein